MKSVPPSCLSILAGQIHPSSCENIESLASPHAEPGRISGRGLRERRSEPNGDSGRWPKCWRAHTTAGSPASPAFQFLKYVPGNWRVVKGHSPIGFGLAGVGAFLVVLFTADLSDPLAFCPRPVCNSNAACVIPACVPWTNPWIWVFAGVALTLVAIGVAVLYRAPSRSRLRAWAVLILGVAALPFGVIGLTFALPSSVPWAPALVVMGLGVIVIAAVTLGLYQNRLTPLSGPN